MSLTKATYSMIEGAPANVLDFGADPTGVADSTAAIQAAQQASKYVYCPPGDYSVAGLRIYDHVNLIGAGYENTRFLQRDPDEPAINCLSDATVGQLLSLRLENFGVVGHASATVAAVKIEALGIYAIYRSHFDMIISQCYQALHILANTANNVFYCTFRMDVVNTATTSVLIEGGTYNTFDFFIAQVGNGRMIEHSGFNNTFIRLTGEGQIVCTGQNTTYISPTIEELFVAPPTPYGFFMNGFNQVLINPTVILNTTNSTRIDYCFRAFSGTKFVAPRIIVDGTLHPFAPITGATVYSIEGLGENSCVNKMEATYDGSDYSKDMRNVSLIGDCSEFSTGSSTFAGATTQYLAPTTSFNLRVNNATDALILSPTGTIPVAGLTLGYAGTVFQNGRTLSIFTSQILTSIVWGGNGSDVTLLPTTLAANATFRAVYDAGTDKWYPN